MSQFDMVTIGDSIVDLLVRIPMDDPNVSLDMTTKKATMLLGSKIPVRESAFSIGGNATHVAIGITRLGFTTALAAELGDDEFAEKILRDLDREKVAKDLLIQTKGAQSTFTVSLSMDSDRTTLVRHVKRKHDYQLENVSTKWVYLTSMGEEWKETYVKTLAYVQKTGAKLAFNPGSTQMKEGIDSFKDVVAQSDVLIVNKEEAERILYKEVLSQEKKESPESLLFRLNRMGPKIVVITDAENGSYALEGSATVVTQKIFPVTITEKTGAGDAFSSGFLAALMLEKNLQDCLLWGTANATGAVTKVGGQEGLLTRQEMENMIQKYQ